MYQVAPVFYEQVYDWSNLLSAWRKASKGKRGRDTCASFEYKLADELLSLQTCLKEKTYQPGAYTQFYIHEPKRRLISAAPFRDRVVHHALCNVIEPVFEQQFISDSYANRAGKGTHAAVDRLQFFSRKSSYVLRLDIVQHFPSIDHAVLLGILGKTIKDDALLDLIKLILISGSISGQNLERGLPIGNLTSQFWSNCYLHPLDQFIKRELGCHAYLRYVDDFALFADSKQQLWEWKQRIREKLDTLKLQFHAHNAQVSPVTSGIPWLGFVVYPTHRHIKKRNVVNATRRLRSRYQQWQEGDISFAEFDAGVQGWINHVRYADSWGLRKKVLREFKR